VVLLLFFLLYVAMMWPVWKVGLVKNNPTKKNPKHLFSSDWLGEFVCFQGVYLILWQKGRGLGPALSRTALELEAGQTVPMLLRPAVCSQ